MSFVILNRSPQTIHQDVLQKIVLVVGSLHGADGLVGTSESKDITILEALDEGDSGRFGSCPLVG